ncbi:MAG: transposase [Bacillota bacterium]|nr:transposase [Bacillota bacterium]
MPRHQRIRSETGYYHIMVRGNEKKNIFNSNEDKQRFMQTMYEKKQGDRYYLHVFCLMDNHIHLMINEGIEDVSNVMKRITVSYVSYFNKKYKRVGHLFQDRFKSETVEQDSYVLSLARYIHQNPVKAGLVEKASDYKWSSYGCYLNEENCFAKIVDTDTILGIFSEDKKTALKKFEEYMKEESEETFLDLKEENNDMDEDTARELFKKMLIEQGLKKGEKMPQMESLIKEFGAKTNLSTRKIADVVGLNKDKINQILRK